VIKELHSRSIGEHRRQGIDPTGGRGIDEPSALETLERATDPSRFEAQANPVVGRYLNEPGMSADKLKGFVDGWENISDTRKVKLVIEGMEHQVPLGEVRRHLEELEGESDWRDVLEDPLGKLREIQKHFEEVEAKDLLEEELWGSLEIVDFGGELVDLSQELVDLSEKLVENSQDYLGVEKVINLKEAVTARKEQTEIIAEIKRITELEFQRKKIEKQRARSRRLDREFRATGVVDIFSELRDYLEQEEKGMLLMVSQGRVEIKKDPETRPSEAGASWREPMIWADFGRDKSNRRTIVLVYGVAHARYKGEIKRRIFHEDVILVDSPNFFTKLKDAVTSALIKDVILVNRSNPEEDKGSYEERHIWGY